MQGDGISKNYRIVSLHWKNLAGFLSITSIWHLPFSNGVMQIFLMLLKWTSICNYLSKIPSFLKPGALKLTKSLFNSLNSTYVPCFFFVYPSITFSHLAYMSYVFPFSSLSLYRWGKIATYLVSLYSVSPYLK